MSIPDPTLLTSLVAKFVEGAHLTPAERAEVLHIAQGFHSKDSASAEARSTETIRARRKRVYKKLRVPGAGELISALLALSLQMLAKGERVEPLPVAVAKPDQGVTLTAMRVAISG